MGDVRVVYRKFDQALHWHLTMRYLGDDEHGTWLGSPIGTVMRRGQEPPVTLPHAHVGLLPRDQWWTAWFNTQPSRVAIYCDITTPPAWPSADEVTMVDLDLDVVRGWGRRRKVSLLDADEFAEHQVRYGYPAEVIDQAEASARWLQRALGDGTEPFHTSYQPWLAQLG